LRRPTGWTGRRTWSRRRSVTRARRRMQRLRQRVGEDSLNGALSGGTQQRKG